MSEKERPRPRRRVDELGLRSAFAERSLPFLVTAMAFLGALAVAGMMGAQALARHWEGGGLATLTLEVPSPDLRAGEATRRERVEAVLRASPAVASFRSLEGKDLERLLAPWLGSGRQLDLPLPLVIEVKLAPQADAAPLIAALTALDPTLSVTENARFLRPLVVLARSLEACAALALTVMGGLAMLVVAVATRAVLAARRDSLEIIHGLGASDGYIARRVANRVGLRALSGGFGGVLAAGPVLFALYDLASPFRGLTAGGGGGPAPDWFALLLLPPVAGGIGWTSAFLTVRQWLRRLP